MVGIKIYDSENDNKLLLLYLPFWFTDHDPGCVYRSILLSPTASPHGMFLNYKYQNKNNGKIFEKAITTGGGI